MHFLDNVTLSQAWQWILSVAGILISADKLLDIYHKWLKASPDGKQDEKIKELDARVTALEQGLAKHDSFFRADKARLDAIEEGNRVMLESLNALLGHAIDGNNVATCQKAKDDLNAYLINRK